MTLRTRKYGLLGRRLDYSFSKSYFTEKFTQENIQATYKNFELSDLLSAKETILKEGLSGFNVTIPYKKDILALVDELTPQVKQIGAANCIQITEENKWIAYNTDVIGFENALLNLIKNDRPNALIFGTGGASRAVQFVLSKLNMEFKLISTSNFENSLSYTDLNEQVLTEYKLLIHTTPLGTYPNIEDCIPLPFEHLNNTHYCFDLIYNPEKTSFLKRAEESGARITNGIEMLRIQAEESWRIWNS